MFVTSVYNATNMYIDMSPTHTNYNQWYLTIDRESVMHFPSGMVIDTRTGEVVLPPTATNMTAVAEEFWEAVRKIAGELKLDKETI